MSMDIGNVEYSCAIYVDRQRIALQESRDPPFFFRFQLLTQLEPATSPETTTLAPMPLFVQEWLFQIPHDSLSLESIRIAVTRMNLPSYLIDNFAARVYSHAVNYLASDLTLLASKAALTFWMILTATIPYNESYEIDRATTESAVALGAVMKQASSVAIAALKKASLNKPCADSTCVICLDELALPDDDEMGAVSLPCSHSYHKDCIVQWLEINHVCPLCRHAMPTN